MPSFLDTFLTPIRNTFTKATQAVQPLFVDAAQATKKYLYDDASQSVKDQWNRTSHGAQQVMKSIESVHGLMANDPMGMKVQFPGGSPVELQFAGGGLENVGKKAIGEVGEIVSKKAVPIFKGVKDMSTKLLEKTVNKISTISSDLIQEARKYKSAEEFVKANDLGTAGIKFHITDNPNFKIDPNIIPSDIPAGMGTKRVLSKIDFEKQLSDDVKIFRERKIKTEPEIKKYLDTQRKIYKETGGGGGLMVTRGLEPWLEEGVLSGKRKYVAIIDTTDVPLKDLTRSTRGFGDEIFINNPKNAKVIKVVPVEEALKIQKEAQSLTKSQLTDIYNQAVKTKKSKTFQGLEGTSTKLLEKFKGLPEEITPQQFQEVLNRAQKEGIKKADLDIVNNSIVKSKVGNINLSKTAENVEKQLVPLTAASVKSPRWSNIGEDFIGDGKYGEIVYQSPIKTSAGDVHYDVRRNWRDRTDQEFPNYFSHVRYEDLADGKTRKILETQSDLMQKGRLEHEIQNNKLYLQNVEEMTKKGMHEGVPNWKSRRVDAIKKATKADIEYQKLQPYNSNDPLAQLRTFREEVKRAAKDGKDTILIPSGETAMKIEGLGSRDTWFDPSDFSKLYDNELTVGRNIQREGDTGSWIITDVLGEGKFKALPKNILGDGDINLKDPLYKGTIEQYSETFDISGRVDTKHFVYKLNEEAIPKEARKMGLEVEKIKLGNNGQPVIGSYSKTFQTEGEWWKIKVNPERSKLPVEAFGALPFLMPKKENKKELFISK